MAHGQRLCARRRCGLRADGRRLHRAATSTSPARRLKAARQRGVRRHLRLAERFSGPEAELLGHPRYRLHVFTSRGRHLLRREGSAAHAAGLPGAFATNAVSRKAMGGWLERVIFSDLRDALPLHLRDYRTHVVPSRPPTCSPASWRAARSRSGCRPCTTFQARPRRLLGRWHHRLPPAFLDYASMGGGLVLIRISRRP